MEELEQFLGRVRGAPTADSEGSFSCDPQRALKIMAENSLPFSYAWMVALGQAVFYCESSQLEVTLSRREIHFNFPCDDHPPAEELERVFRDPTSVVTPAWQRLRLAVWGAALGEGREVSLSLGDRRYHWSNGALEVHPLSPSLGPNVQFSVVLAVKTSFWKSLGLIRVRADLSKEVRLRFFGSPFRVMFDGARVDGFHLNPTNGFSPRSRPVELIWLNGDDALGLPPSHREAWTEPYPQSPARFLSERFDHRPAREPVAGAAVLAAHLSTGHEHSGGGGDTLWTAHKSSSELFWIREGVTLRQEKLPLGSMSLSLTLILSADNLLSDLTGFGLDEKGMKASRRCYLQKLIARLEHHEWDPQLADLRSRAEIVTKSFGSLMLGLMGLPFTHGVSFVLVAAGIAGIVLNSGMATLQRVLVRDYSVLRESLNRAVTDDHLIAPDRP